MSYDGLFYYIDAEKFDTRFEFTRGSSQKVPIYMKKRCLGGNDEGEDKAKPSLGKLIRSEDKCKIKHLCCLEGSLA